MNQQVERIANTLQPNLLNVTMYAGEVSLHVSPDKLFGTLQQLKEQYGFDYLVDIGTIDHYTDTGRFEVFYNLFNLADKIRIRVKCRLEEEDPEVESITSMWPGAAWHEREAWDMMGIRFRNNEDLRRIFMPEDFEFFPHRKEFPLIGIPGSIELPEKDAPKGYK
jgi:NADH-quinone oxidoreductase subunit C